MNRLYLLLLFTSIVSFSINCNSSKLKTQPTKSSMNRALLAAARGGNYKKVIKALQKGADVNAHDDIQSTPLINAAWEGHVEIVEALLERGADINAVNKHNISALHLAIQRQGDSKTVRLLLKKGAEIHVRTFAGQTPLNWAAFGGHTDTVKNLLELGADVSSRDLNQDTPLHEAASHFSPISEGDQQVNIPSSHVEVVKTLINQGAMVDARNKWDNTPLYDAVRYGNTNITIELLSHGANINAVCEKGRTPLIAAIGYGFTKTSSKLINLLIKAGADVNAQEQNGKTALMHAKEKTIRDLLIKAGAKK